MRGISRHLYLERRRLILAGLLAFIAGFALYAHINSSVLGVPFPVFTALLYAVLVVLTAATTTYLLPNLRWLIDGVAVSRLGFAIWVVGVHGQEIAASPLASAGIVVGGAIILLRLSAWIDKMSRGPHAPIAVLNVSAQARAVLDWIDNAAARDGGNAPCQDRRHEPLAAI